MVYRIIICLERGCPVRTTCLFAALWQTFCSSSKRIFTAFVQLKENFLFILHLITSSSSSSSSLSASTSANFRIQKTLKKKNPHSLRTFMRLSSFFFLKPLSCKNTKLVLTIYSNKGRNLQPFLFSLQQFSSSWFKALTVSNFSISNFSC